MTPHSRATTSCWRRSRTARSSTAIRARASLPARSCPLATRTVTAPTPRAPPPATAGCPPTLLGVDRGVVSGIAPRARISIYKACWTIAPGEGGCSNGDLVKAIDDAVADGVDVINYSIGSESASLSPDAISFLFANNAGVLVAASAGNSGPDAVHDRFSRGVAMVDIGRCEHAAPRLPWHRDPR